MKPNFSLWLDVPDKSCLVVYVAGSFVADRKQATLNQVAHAVLLR